MTIFSVSRRRRRAELRDEDRRAEAGGHRDHHRQQRHRAVPAISASAPYCARMRESGRQLMLVKNSHEVELPEEKRRAFAEDEEEDAEDEEDRAPAAQPDQPLDERLGDRPEPRRERAPHRHRSPVPYFLGAGT